MKALDTEQSFLQVVNKSIENQPDIKKILAIEHSNIRLFKAKLKRSEANFVEAASQLHTLIVKEGLGETDPDVEHATDLQGQAKKQKKETKEEEQ